MGTTMDTTNAAGTTSGADTLTDAWLARPDPGATQVASPTPVRCITLWQPWATLLVAGFKRIETRGWSTDVRGPLLVHAAKCWGNGEQRASLRAYPMQAALIRLGYGRRGHAGFELPRPLPTGQIVGMVTLKDVVPTVELLARGGVDDDEFAFGNYGPDRFAWLTERAVSFTRAVPARGSQGFWFPTAGEMTDVRLACPEVGIGV